MGQTRPASSNVHAANPKALKVNKQLRNVAAGTLAGIVAAGSTVAPVQAIEAPVVQARVGGTIGHLAAQDAPPVVELPKDGDWKYSDFVAGVLGKKIQKVEFEATGAAINAFGTEGQKGHVNLPNDRDLIDILINNNVDIFVQDPNSGLSGFLNLLSNLAIPLIFLGGLLVINRSRGGMSGPAGGPMQMGKAKDKFQEIPETGVTFADVAGVDGAKLELKEVVDFLKSPEKYTNLGAKIPKGALLAGPPGTGKTLLAKAVAGEAGVPFFSTSASEFVELFVGVGASRVRDLFTRAKEKAPCIVFIDEIDAVGRQRGAGMGGGNDEREQTINQLLTEMDGFEGNSGVIVLAATNRPDVLDNALLRPGRFDRQITVDRPDVKGRVKILEVHSKGKALASDVDLDLIARRCPGFTGADLQNLMNEAAILTARRGLKETGATEIADALEKIVAGAEKSGAVISAEKKKLVAYHEAGHALVGALMPEYDPVAKISILPRGGAGGLTFFAPSEERLESGLYSRSYLENQMAVALGGRIAEELIWGENGITTGASNDFQQVSRTARMMVTQMGYSDKLGQVAVSQGGGPSFLGQQAGQPSPMSQLTADIVDSEVKNLVEIAYRRAKDCMQTNISILHKLAEVLLEKETIDGDECAKIIKEAGGEMYLKEDAPGVTIPYAAKV
jgi:cell division protease FtsH